MAHLSEIPEVWKPTGRDVMDLVHRKMYVD
jgi:hypothetical protein